MASSSIGFANLFASATTVTASTEDATGPKEDAFDRRTNTFWRPTAAPATLTADMGSAVDVDWFGLASHTLGTAGASIVLQYSSDNFSADTNNAFTAASPTTDRPIWRQFATISARYWRLSVTGAVANIGLALFGERLDLPVGMRSGFSLITEARDNKVINQTTEGGHFIGSTIFGQGGTASIELRNLTPAWVRANWCTLADAIEGRPFFFQHDNTNHPSETVLARLQGGIPTPRFTSPNYMSVALDVDVLNR